LYFQTLDDKGECVGVYKGGELFFGDLPEGLKRTWKYAEYLDDQDIEYASLYCKNPSLESACPSYLIDDWVAVENKLKAYYRSFVLAKVNMNENCFFDLVPKPFLMEYCKIRNKITKYVFENYEKPQNYDFLSDLTKVLTSIRNQKLNIDVSSLSGQAHLAKFRKAMKKYAQIDPYCRYNISGTKTGRLTTQKNSFPIMTMDKDFRSIVKPQNDWFVELDFNAAELRTLIALGGATMPPEDLHQWNATNLFNARTTRVEAKQRLFSWLYDENKENAALSKIYDRDKVRSKFWIDGVVKTMFGREIEADRSHALNYIIQSTTADLVLRQVIKIYDFLKNKDSFISFTIHDNIVLDIPDKERYIIPEMIEIFSDTALGKFKVNVKAGKSFGELRTLNL
tara:strand:+ start:226 stop:1413 length:1188 start_codon:yes stop_codon:yes gene_type:complete